MSVEAQPPPTERGHASLYVIESRPLDREHRHGWDRWPYVRRAAAVERAEKLARSGRREVRLVELSIVARRVIAVLP